MALIEGESRFAAALAALKTELTTLLKPAEGFEVFVYASDDAGDGFRIHEIDVHTHVSGYGWQRGSDPYAQALILSAEDFVRTYGTAPFRPAGWQSDIDEHADAREALADTVEQLSAE